MQGSKDKDSGAAVDGVNPASGNMRQQEKQKSCALGTVVENGSKKQAHVEAAEDGVCGDNPDNMHQQNYTLQEKEKRANVEAVSEENKRDHVEDEDENEDDEDYVDNMKMKMMMMLKMKMKMKMKVTVTVEIKIKMTAMS